MKYFSAAWASGDVTDAESSQIVADYARDLDAAFHADSSIRRFAGQVGLNDAYVDRVSFDSGAGRLNLLLLTGDLSVGYWHTELAYMGVSQITGEQVLKAALANRPTEIWYDEFSREGGDICHAFLLAPRGASLESAGEFGIVFKDFDYSQMLASDRLLKTIHDQSHWGSR